MDITEEKIEKICLDAFRAGMESVIPNAETETDTMELKETKEEKKEEKSDSAVKRRMMIIPFECRWRWDEDTEK